jgi:uncharacterized protein (TIGR03083 family)
VAEGEFASWVAPLAARIAEGRDAVVEFARSLDEAAWEEPSVVEGWRRRDVLAHLAGDTDKVTIAVLRAAADPNALAPSYGDGDAVVNARDLEVRRGWSIEELIAEIQADGEEWRRLISQLGEEDGGKRWPGFPVDVARYLGLLAEHDPEHLEQMR